MEDFLYTLGAVAIFAIVAWAILFFDDDNAEMQKKKKGECNDSPFSTMEIVIETLYLQGGTLSMNINDKDYCDQCKKEVPTGIWWAKDGHEYCNACYRQKYPKWEYLL